MVICPGGGYGGLAPHEGQDYARFLNDHGIAGFVLKYRLGPGGYRHPAMLQDAARALRTVRAKAADWKLDPKRIGIIGSSAGGHLASTLLTHFDAGNPGSDDTIEFVWGPNQAALGDSATIGVENAAGDKSKVIAVNQAAAITAASSKKLTPSP